MQLSNTSWSGIASKLELGTWIVTSRLRRRADAMVEFTIVDGKVLFDRALANTLRKQAAAQNPGADR